jgi:hypothetical protein
MKEERKRPDREDERYRPAAPEIALSRDVSDLRQERRQGARPLRHAGTQDRAGVRLHCPYCLGPGASRHVGDPGRGSPGDCLVRPKRSPVLRPTVELGGHHESGGLEGIPMSTFPCNDARNK